MTWSRATSEDCVSFLHLALVSVLVWASLGIQHLSVRVPPCAAVPQRVRAREQHRLKPQAPRHRVLSVRCIPMGRIERLGEQCVQKSGEYGLEERRARNVGL